MSSLNIFYVFLIIFQFWVHQPLALEDYVEDPNWQEEFPEYIVEGKDKRHLAAMAKNNRLPFSHFNGKRMSNSDRNIMETIEQAEKLLSSAKKNETESKSMEPEEQKRHVGAFLRMHGNPVSAFRGSRGWDNENDDSLGKRNIAALARMGRLQVKSWPYGPSRELNDDCVEDGEVREEETNRIREKRYIAALARNGRLPPLRGFRPQWWSDKRTKNQEMYTWPPYQFPKSLTDKRIQKGVTKTTRCKKLVNAGYLMDEDNELGVDMSGFQKRNVGLLARKGLLSSRPFVPRK